MRRVGIVLVLVALIPAALTAYGMVKAFNTGAPPDVHLTSRALTLDFLAIPLLVLGLALQVAAAIRKRRRTRVREEAA